MCIRLGTWIDAHAQGPAGSAWLAATWTDALRTGAEAAEPPGLAR